MEPMMHIASAAALAAAEGVGFVLALCGDLVSTDQATPRVKDATCLLCAVDFADGA